MVNVFLFIELLKMTDAAATADRLKALELAECKFANVVVLGPEKLVAQLDCESYDGASKAILEKIAPVEGFVQTNLIAAVRPVHPK